MAGGLGNDPLMTCDPVGMPGYLFLEVSIYPMEFIQTSKRAAAVRMGQRLSTDPDRGRDLPKDPDPHGWDIRRPMGRRHGCHKLHGFDERTLLDHFGNPVSEEARMEERYRRVDRDTLELTITLTDPKAYAKTWVSEMKKFKHGQTEVQNFFACHPEMTLPSTTIGILSRYYSQIVCIEGYLHRVVLFYRILEYFRRLFKPTSAA